MKLLTRLELKKIKRDIMEQLKNDIEENNLYINGFVYIGDNTYISNDLTIEKRFTGNVKKSEIGEDGYKLVKFGNYELQIVVEDEQVDFYILCKLEDLEGYEDFEKWIKLDI